MSLKDKIEAKNKVVENKPTTENKSNDINLSLQELEFLIRLIGDSNFKGKDLMFIFDLVKKLQDFYVQQKGAK